MSNGKIIALASDHAGYQLKQYVKEYLAERGYGSEDLGCFNEESCDYPDFAHKLGSAIDGGEYATGIAICGTGQGMAISLNKHAGVRAALCWTPEIAHMARLHNNANVLVMPGRYISQEESKAIMDEFFSTAFEGGRHERRVAKIPLQNQDK